MKNVFEVSSITYDDMLLRRTPRLCKKCGKNISSRAQLAVYCLMCAHQPSRKIYPTLSTGKVGAIGELRTSADLLSRGYEVFRAVSPACSCDLIALKGDNKLRIEVRTGWKANNGKLAFPKNKTGVVRHDHYAVVLLNEVVYVPELPVSQS